MTDKIEIYKRWLCDYLGLEYSAFLGLEYLALKDALNESSNVMDSLEFVETIMQFEKLFNCEVREEDLQPSDFGTLNNYLDWLLTFTNKDEKDEKGKIVKKKKLNELDKIIEKVSSNWNKNEIYSAKTVSKKVAIEFAKHILEEAYKNSSSSIKHGFVVINKASITSVIKKYE